MTTISDIVLGYNRADMLDVWEKKMGETLNKKDAQAVRGFDWLRNMLVEDVEFERRIKVMILIWAFSAFRFTLAVEMWETKSILRSSHLTARLQKSNRKREGGRQTDKNCTLLGPRHSRAQDARKDVGPTRHIPLILKDHA